MATWKPLYEIGSTVSLKAGGPVMTVHILPTAQDRSYKCQWFAGKKLDQGAFREEELIPAVPKPPLPAPAEETKP